MSRPFWGCWVAAVATTGIVAGFMLSHALLLGRFIDWLLTSGRGDVLAATYPVFARSAGHAALQAFYAISALQVLAGLAFFVASCAARRARLAGAIVAVSSVAWPAVHYASGFGTVEAQVLRSAVEVPRDIAARFVAWNVSVHLFHAGVLAVALGALASVPLSRRTTRP